MRLRGFGAEPADERGERRVCENVRENEILSGTGDFSEPSFRDADVARAETSSMTKTPRSARALAASAETRVELTTKSTPRDAKTSARVRAANARAERRTSSRSAVSFSSVFLSLPA